MVWLKSCSHCHGDLCEKADEYGRYISCLQCSRSPDSERVKEFMATERKEIRLASSDEPSQLPLLLPFF